MSNEPENCPHCKVSLLGDPIPKKYLEHYSGTHFKREIGIEVRGFYDGVAYYECPDCKGKWGAWLKEFEDWSNNEQRLYRFKNKF